MSFPHSVSDAALSASGRCCCICHKFCGTKIELHHIKQVAYGGEDTFDNCIPLCFDCHADMGKADLKHNKGKRYTEAELRMHRDSWYNAIANGAAHVIKFANNTSKVEICDKDKELFNTICEAFSAKIRYALKYPAFYYPYERNMFNPLDFLLYESYDPACFFINQELEALKAELYEGIDSFTEYLYLHTYPVNKDMPDKNATHSWLLNHDYIQETPFHKDRAALEKEFDLEVEQINSLALELWNLYSQFVKKGRILINS